MAKGKKENAGTKFITQVVNAKSLTNSFSSVDYQYMVQN